MSMTQYEWFELVFSSAEPKGSFVQIPLHAAIEKDGRTWNVDGFYSGKGCYRLRFLPEQAGVYRYHVYGCVEAEGSFSVEPAEPDSHGIVRTAGTRFVFLLIPYPSNKKSKYKKNPRFLAKSRIFGPSDWI